MVPRKKTRIVYTIAPCSRKHGAVIVANVANVASIQFQLPMANWNWGLDIGNILTLATFAAAWGHAALPRGTVVLLAVARDAYPYRSVARRRKKRADLPVSSITVLPVA